MPGGLSTAAGIASPSFAGSSAKMASMPAALQKNITVRQVKNGYIASVQAFDPARSYDPYYNEEHVFDTLEAVSAYLQEYFTKITITHDPSTPTPAT